MTQSSTSSATNRPGWGPLGCLLAGIACVAVFIGVVLAWGALIGNAPAIGAAKAYGLTNVRVVNSNIVWPELLGCSADDFREVTVTGTNAQHEQVTLHVCNPPLWFMGMSVRVAN